MSAISLKDIRRRLALFSFLVAATFCLMGVAGYRTTNFTVRAPTPQLAKEFGDCAELCRKELAIYWLGKELPRWAEPCPITATCSPRLGAGGATSFVFDQGEVFGWRMNVQGTRERILDSVLPHEITHTIFATHFRQPVPRWADEGACTMMEHRSEIGKHERMLIDFLKVRPGERSRGIPFTKMLYMPEYPEDVLPFYAQGHSLAHFLILLGGGDEAGARKFIKYIENGLSDDDWPRATRNAYGYEHVLALQNSWLDWVKAGRPTTPAAVFEMLPEVVLRRLVTAGIERAFNHFVTGKSFSTEDNFGFDPLRDPYFQPLGTTVPSFAGGLYHLKRGRWRGN